MRFHRTAVMAATSLFSAMTILPSFVAAQTLPNGAVPNGVVPNGGGAPPNNDAAPNKEKPQKKAQPGAGGAGGGPNVIQNDNKPNQQPNAKAERHTPNVGAGAGGNGGPGGNDGERGGGNRRPGGSVGEGGGGNGGPGGNAGERGGGENKKFGGGQPGEAPVKAPKAKPQETVKTPDTAKTPITPNTKTEDTVTTPTQTDRPRKRDKNSNPVVINPGAGGNAPSKGAEGGPVAPKTKPPTETTRDSTPDIKSPDRRDNRNNEPPTAPTTDRPQNGGAPERSAKSFDEVKRTRTEKTFGGGKGVVIEEADKRKIFKSGNTVVIQHDETERLRRVAPNARFERRGSGVNVSIIDRPGNIRIYNETDANGQLIRRYRRGPDGRDVIIIDNRRRKHNFGKDIAIGAGIGLGVAAGAAILNSFVDVPPPRVRIPRDRYIVDYERASDDDVYEALSAPPIEDVREGYSLDEIRATVALRDRMRRVDLDDITFEFGSFEVDPSQYGKLDRIARAMQRVIERNPNEVFMIEGYTDAVGSREDNLSLSDRRAESVAEVLTREFRVPYENLTTQGYGEDFLKVQTDAPERANRRVAVRRITPLLSRNDRQPPPPPAGYEQRGDAQDQQYDSRGPDDRGPPPDDRQDGSQGPDDQGPPPDDRGGGGNNGGDYQYSPYRSGDRPD